MNKVHLFACLFLVQGIPLVAEAQVKIDNKSNESIRIAIKNGSDLIKDKNSASAHTINTGKTGQFTLPNSQVYTLISVWSPSSPDYKKLLEQKTAPSLESRLPLTISKELLTKLGLPSAESAKIRPLLEGIIQPTPAYLYLFPAGKKIEVNWEGIDKGFKPQLSGLLKRPIKGNVTAKEIIPVQYLTKSGQGVAWVELIVKQ
jgi:hypothetical protein